ncbi:AIM24 family protein [Deinococcus sp.]|uniref:AIM24 family protein n=1 Tax=Deinococcus sp. TaxID=47478 RepID=UPI003B5C3CF1
MEKRRENLKQLDTAAGRGVTFTTYQSPVQPHDLYEAEYFYAADRLGMRPNVLEIKLDGGGALLQPGAFQFSRGHVRMQSLSGMQGSPGMGQSGNQGGGLGGLLGGVARMAAGRAMGESSSRNLFEGRGVVWTEPTYKHLIIGEKDTVEGNYIIDDGAFYACESSMDMSPRLMLDARAFGGNGMVSPELKGSGYFVLESPVPFEEIEIHTLQNDEMRVDGDLILLFSSSLRFNIEKFDRGWLSTYRSGEGLIYSLTGSGVVWLTPTAQAARKQVAPPGSSSDS